MSQGSSAGLDENLEGIPVVDPSTELLSSGPVEVDHCSRQSWFDLFMVVVVAISGSLFLRLLNLTIRWQKVGLDGPDRYWPCGELRILAFWHDHSLLMPWIYLSGRRRRLTRPIVILISKHQDGRLIAGIMRCMGIDSIAGSSSRGGREALAALIRRVKGGSHAALTPDGPKGPRHEVKEGIIRLAQKTGVPIYPAAISAKNPWRFRGWDKMLLPKPFSKAAVLFGDPIAIPRNVSKEEVENYALQLRNALNELSVRGNECIGETP